MLDRNFCASPPSRVIMIPMTRRAWLMAFAAMPVVRAVRSLDLVKVTVRSDGREYAWWEPRAVAEKRFADVMALFRSARKRSA